MTKRYTGVFLVSLLLPTAVFADQKALVIGASEYPNLPAERQLPGAARDADKFATFLVENWGYREQDIKIIKGHRATKRTIVAAIKEHLQKGTKAGDKLVFYFSGHGTQITDLDGDEKEDGKDEALVPSDVREIYDESAIHQYISDDEIKELFAPLGDRQVLMVIDSCHSGTLTRAASNASDSSARQKYFPSHLPPSPRSRSTLTVGPTRETFTQEFNEVTLLAAALPHQYAWEDGNLGGVFTHYFIEGLTTRNADLNRNGKTSISEQTAFLRGKTQEWCNNTQECLKKGLGFSPNFEPKTITPTIIDNWEVAHESTAAEPSDIIPAVNSEEIAILLIGATPDGSLKLGETFRIGIASKIAGYITLFDVRANGELQLLYPFEEDELLDIVSNQNLKLPRYNDGFDLVASAPLGKGQLLLVVTEEKVDFAKLIANTRSITPMANPEETLGDFAAELFEALINEAYQTEDGDWAGVRLPKWSAASLEYFVE